MGRYRVRPTPQCGKDNIHLWGSSGITRRPPPPGCGDRGRRCDDLGNPVPDLRLEAGGDAGEVPVVLGDAATGRLDSAAGAPAVAVDRPERQAGEALGIRIVTNLGPDGQRGQLLL